MNGLKSMIMKKYKYNKNKKMHENIFAFCEAYNLSVKALEEIRKLCSESYIKGSNDCYDIFVKK